MENFFFQNENSFFQPGLTTPYGVAIARKRHFFKNINKLILIKISYLKKESILFLSNEVGNDLVYLKINIKVSVQ